MEAETLFTKQMLIILRCASPVMKKIHLLNPSVNIKKSFYFPNISWNRSGKSPHPTPPPDPHIFWELHRCPECPGSCIDSCRVPRPFWELNQGMTKLYVKRQKITKNTRFCWFVVFFVVFSATWKGLVREIQGHPRDHTESFWLMLIGFDFTRHQEVHNSFFWEFVGTRNGLQTLRICSWSPQNVFVCVTSIFQNHIF